MKLNILIVEDEIEIREGVSEYLSEVGYNVITAEDGLQAIELFNKNKIAKFIGYFTKSYFSIFLNFRFFSIKANTAS